MSAWPGEEYRHPHKGVWNWSLREPLARWLEEEGRSAAGLRVLDIGCGIKPYYPYFSSAAEYVGVDLPGNPVADVVGAIEQLPLDDASFDLVLCLQVLEHCDDPARAVAEMHRVVKPGGRILAATHGTYVYHPSPVDYWRWTHTGLERLFNTNAEWQSVSVTPGAGTTACLGLLVATYVDLLFHYGHADWAGRIINRGVNTVAATLDSRSRKLRDAVPGSLTTNFHLTAVHPVKALVTGGGGFIGSNLVRGLLERGDDVRVLDNFSTGNRSNLTGLDVEVVEGELRSYERVHNAIRDVEVVFHLGALGSVPRSVQDPLTSNAVNVDGTLNVLLAARDSGVRRVVFSSSSSVYGASGNLPSTEAMPPDPISPYGVAKLAAERYCVSFSRVYESFETVVLRYFNVFGPRQSPSSQYAAVVPLFLTAIANSQPITIFGDGLQSRDFTYVANVVDATMRAADVQEANGRIFNVAAGSPASVLAVAHSIGRILGREPDMRFAPARPGDIRDSWADVGEAQRVLGYETSVELEEGLRFTAEALIG